MTLTVPVLINAGDRGGEIIVVDDSFRKIASGVGSLSLQLQAGLYKARFKAGNRSEDHLFEVMSAAVTVQGTPLLFASPIPMPATSTNHEYHFYPSREIARGAPSAVIGVGAELFIFVRDSQQQYGSPPATPPPWTCMTVHKRDGAIAFKLDEQGQVDAGSAYAAARLSVGPGQYFLESNHPALSDRTIAFPVVTCVGWATHVYIDSHDTYVNRSAKWERNRTPDLAGAAVAMVKMTGSPDLDEDMVRLTETARQALTRDRGALSDIDLDAMLAGRSEFPMLGLYAAHALLNRPDPDWQRIGLILQHLQLWLASEHPDVSTLLLACATKGTALPPLSRTLWPPTLAATWAVADRENLPTLLGERRDSLLWQHRAGGSIWNSLLFPSDSTRPYVDDDGDLGTSRGLGSLRSIPPAAPVRSGPDSGAGPHRGSESALPKWRQLAAGLRRINPHYTPFQQAARRLVLDASAQDAVENVDFQQTLSALIRQFKVPPDLARELLHQLEVDASPPGPDSDRWRLDWSRLKWSIVRSDIEIAAAMLPLKNFTLQKSNGASPQNTYRLAHPTAEVVSGYFKDTFFREAGHEVPRLGDITHNGASLPRHSPDTDALYVEVSELMSNYLLQKPDTRRLEGVMKIPCHPYGSSGHADSVPGHTPMTINTPIQFFQFPDAIEGGLSLLFARAPLSPFCPMNGDGTAIGFGM